VTAEAFRQFSAMLREQIGKPSKRLEAVALRGRAALAFGPAPQTASTA